MRTLNLDFPIMDLDEKEFNRAGKVLGQILCAETGGDALKYYDWAREIYKGQPIKVDDSDFRTIKAFVENNTKMMNIVKGQIIKYLETVKDEK